MPATAKSAFTLATARTSNAAALTRTQVAETLGVDQRTVSAAIARGELPSIKLGRRVLIPRERFLAMFDTTAGRPGAA